MQKKLLSALINDLPGIVERMIYLKNRVPELDVNQAVLNCPQILLKSNFIGIPGNLDKLERRIQNRVDMVGLVQQQPLILFEDVDTLCEKLQRLFPDDGKPLELMRGGSNQEATTYLCRNPGVMFMLQRGDKELGPPAEVVQKD